MTITSMTGEERDRAQKANGELDDKVLAFIKERSPDGVRSADLAHLGNPERGGRDIDRSLQRLRTRGAIRHDPRIGWLG